MKTYRFFAGLGVGHWANCQGQQFTVGLAAMCFGITGILKNDSNQIGFCAGILTAITSASFMETYFPSPKNENIPDPQTSTLPQI